MALKIYKIPDDCLTPFQKLQKQEYAIEVFVEDTPVEKILKTKPIFEWGSTEHDRLFETSYMASDFYLPRYSIDSHGVLIQMKFRRAGSLKHQLYLYFGPQHLQSISEDYQKRAKLLASSVSEVHELTQKLVKELQSASKQNFHVLVASDFHIPDTE